MGNHGGDKSNNKNLPRLAVVPYAVVECLSKGGRTPNQLRVELEEIMIKDEIFQKEDWEFFF